MPEPRPLVAIQRQSGSVSDICLSGEASNAFSIAASRLFQPPARLDPVEIAVNVELEHRRRMVRRPARRCRIDAIEPEVEEFQRIDEHIDRANRVALVDPIIEAFRQQRRLLAIHPLNETLHHPPAIQQGNHSIDGVFTRPGSKPEELESSKCLPLFTNNGHSAVLHCPLPTWRPAVFFSNSLPIGTTRTPQKSSRSCRTMNVASFLIDLVGAEWWEPFGFYRF